MNAEPPMHAISMARPKTTLGTRKVLNQMLSKIVPQSATNATSKQKPLYTAFSSFHSNSLARSLKPSHSLDARELIKRDRSKSFKKNNLSVTIDQSRQAYGFTNVGVPPSPVDKM